MRVYKFGNDKISIQQVNSDNDEQKERILISKNYNNAGKLA